MRYGSVCSGIEAASQAWGPLGWTPEFFSEIDKFPSAVLAHHYGSNMPGDEITGNGVPNYGDMTDFERWPDHAIDILVGGTPCQDYSVAGLRAGMAGDRGSLTLTYIEIAARYRPDWIVWENVPGVLSSNNGKDFAKFLGDISGTKIEVPADGWKNSGIVEGIKYAYGLAYRVLDTQFCRVDGFGRAIPQRRRRVFVVGYLGDWRRAAAVLLEPESLRRDFEPRRKAGEGFAASVAPSLRSGGPGAARTGDVSKTICANSQQSLDNKFETIMAFNSREDPEVTGDRTGPLGASSPQAQAVAYDPMVFDENQITSKTNRSIPTPGICHTMPAATVPPTLFGENWAVRRLTPTECERLQGFPDGFTQIPWRKKTVDQCPDGPRYKALGNSMSVNVMRWIGTRIQMIEDMQ